MPFLTTIFLGKFTWNFLVGLLIQQIRFANFSVLYIVFKQASHAWFAKFSTTIHDFGFTASSYNFALFVRKTAQGTTLLLLYVDDMIIIGDDIHGILSLKQFFCQRFEMKDLGILNYLLGSEVSHDSTGYYLSQAKYTSDLLTHTTLTDCKTASTPIDPQTRLTPLDAVLSISLLLAPTLHMLFILLVNTCRLLALFARLIMMLCFASYVISKALSFTDFIIQLINLFSFMPFLMLIGLGIFLIVAPLLIFVSS